MLEQFTNKEKQKINNLLDTLIDENENELAENGYIIFPSGIKILKLAGTIYTVLYNSMWFQLDFEKKTFDIINEALLHEVYVNNYVENNIGKFERFLWQNNYSRAYSIAEITKAKKDKYNVIIKEGDIDEIDLGIEQTENADVLKVTVYNNSDYSLFKFSEAWEIKTN